MARTGAVERRIVRDGVLDAEGAVLRGLRALERLARRGRWEPELDEVLAGKRATLTALRTVAPIADRATERRRRDT